MRQKIRGYAKANSLNVFLYKCTKKTFKYLQNVISFAKHLYKSLVQYEYKLN